MTVSDTVERVARAWAVMDGKADLFDAGKDHAPDHPDYTGHYDGYMFEAEDLLLSLRPGDELPNGLVVVPKEPTNRMIFAGADRAYDYCFELEHVAAIGIWNAMLLASRPEGEQG